MSRLVLFVLAALLPLSARASEAVLSADRPGVGESTGTPGVGFANLEGGLATTIVDGQVHPGTSSITIRVGVDEGVELRGVLPNFTLVDGEVVVGPLAVGFKMAGRASDHITLSAVPDLLVGLDGGSVGWRLSSNAGLSAGNFSLWVNATTTVLDGVDVFAGAGTSWSFGGGGIYVNAGREVVSQTTLVGGGGWWSLSRKSQLDAGIDFWLQGSEAVVVPQIGASTAF